MVGSRTRRIRVQPRIVAAGVYRFPGVFPPGDYRMKYLCGSMGYGGAGSEFVVGNGDGRGFKGVRTAVGTGVEVEFPLSQVYGGPVGARYPVELDCWVANIALPPTSFSLSVPSLLGVRLDDDPVSDNVAGRASPMWDLELVHRYTEAAGAAVRMVSAELAGNILTIVFDDDIVDVPGDVDGTCLVAFDVGVEGGGVVGARTVEVTLSGSVVQYVQVVSSGWILFASGRGLEVGQRIDLE